MIAFGAVPICVVAVPIGLYGAAQLFSADSGTACAAA